MPVLIASQLQKKYKDRFAVKDVSLTVESGQIVGLLGPNGAGKTTSFYMIVGLISLDHGSIHIDKQDLTHLAMHTRARLGIGYLPQEKSIFRKLSVADNVMAILELRNDLSKAEKKARLNELLAEFHIEHLRNIPAMSLSGGETRRVEIARALAMDPKFILLDEPFAGVDPISVIDIKKIILHLSKREIGILITDHNVRETLDICEHAYIVNEGSIIAQGTPEAILSHKEVREVYLGEDFYL
ncbi:MAG: LPS export ABC transporter ATP-binding protein [Gammaproteobacteria bacterium CG_4_10_14_0_8_um_filter_38_16]|nr:MAG: LPS export ABC transporter ATP-binding protein [Gammaproteobacteria bacterium CG_4_10_14_0_8_um_filter_38_16]PJA04188.1 MAG: LPS export ABC transporter ATP-binding protein [Gammaproteobacteria bacterium CG_4_10_14_0_2_um_filter_38_22]PJB10367.1 MAG: LPS export ABC transporter ATP-binding protein [Gammaproteobacteria bacterium CG_4_9_14_3_um_filter_38_9]